MLSRSPMPVDTRDPAAMGVASFAMTSSFGRALLIERVGPEKRASPNLDARRRCKVSVGLAPRQALLLQPPFELVEAVLAEEGLIVERDHRHAVVAGGALGDLAFLDDGVQTLGLVVDRAGDFDRVEAGALGGAGQVVALVPVVDRAAPDHPAGLVEELKATPAFGGGDAHPRQAMD